MGRWSAKLRNLSLLTRGFLLGLAVVLVYAVLAPVAVCCNGPAGLWAAAAAGAFCLGGAALALVASYLLCGPKYALHGLLVAMAARMGIPLSLGLACQLYGGVLAEAGLLYYLMVFYPVTLGVETALSLPQLRPCERGSRVGDAVT